MYATNGTERKEKRWSPELERCEESSGIPLPRLRWKSTLDITLTEEQVGKIYIYIYICVLGVKVQIKQKTHTAKISNVFFFRKSRRPGKEEAQSFTSSTTLRKEGREHSLCLHFNHELEHVGPEQRHRPHAMVSAQGLEGSVLYGLRIPLGSNMALKRCIRKIASLGLLYWMNCFFLKPSPCSALMLPLYLAVHSYTNGSMASRREWL